VRALYSFRAPPCFLIGNLETNWDDGDETSLRIFQSRNQGGTKSVILIGAPMLMRIKKSTAKKSLK
jgi:hypothetical protein